MIYLLVIGFMLLSWFVGWRLKSKFNEYSQVPFAGNMTGAQVAERMLHDMGITDVKIVSVEGQLTDHYNPAEKTVNLSPDVYHGRSVAAAAVAAHECGHAVQHARAYTWLGFRSALVPAVSFASRYMQWILLAGVLMLSFSLIPLAIGVALFAITTFFAFVTLPVEFDASNRALAWLNTAGIVNTREHEMAKDALKWAAMTYVVAALYSLSMLVYYASMLLRRRD